jgi:hypothetical protein
MSSSTKKKEQDECPPGMDRDADGKCVAAEKVRREEENAGDSSDKGEPTLTDASTKPNPADTHDCGEGFTWDGEQCVPSGGGDAGTGGGAGTGDPDTPGKEAANERFYKMIEKLMASHSSYNQMLLEDFKKSNTEALMELLSKDGKPIYRAESAAYGVRSEKLMASMQGGSSMVNDADRNSVYEQTVKNPAAFFESCRPNKGGALKEGFAEWTINPQAYFETLKKGWLNYSMSHAHGKLEGTNNAKGEAFTISAGDMPQIFSKQVYLVPGGRMRVPIRQFLDTQIIEDADRFNWYTVNGFAFDGSQSEGTAETEESQTITKVTATPALVRALQTVNYSDIENAPFDLIEAFNRAAALGALDAEAKDVLDTVYDAVSVTNWVEADGSVITEDDTTNPGTAQQEMIYAGMRLIQNQGGDTSPGNMCAFLHPKALQELILDVTTEFWAGAGGAPAQSPQLMNTSMGVLENRVGVDIIATNKVAAQDNTTNDTYRNVLMMKGSIGLAVAADLQIEAQRRPDLSAVKVGARHRIKGAVIDETMTCRMSTAQ